MVSLQNRKAPEHFSHCQDSEVSSIMVSQDVLLAQGSGVEESQQDIQATTGGPMVNVHLLVVYILALSHIAPVCTILKSFS